MTNPQAPSRRKDGETGGNGFHPAPQDREQLLDGDADGDGDGDGDGHAWGAGKKNYI